MKRRFQSSNIVLSDGLFDGYVYTENGKITAVTDEELPFDEEIRLGTKYLAPGLIDLHVHGAVGVDFGNCDAEQAQRAVQYHLAHGTTAILPTFAAAPERDIDAALSRLSDWAKASPVVVGFHLEGPYFSPAQCGAQNTDFITAPIQNEYELLIERYGDIIARWSYAPERDENHAFCKALAKAGILPSAGHTDATGEDMEGAFANGCKLITHLYSCTSTVTRKGGYRHLGVIEYAFLQKEIVAELIADGAHLPPDLLRMIFQIKGRDKLALVTDALSACGLEATEGELNGTPYIVEDGVCKLPDRSAFAGSIATADRLVRTCVQKVGLSLVDSIYMAATVPADLLGLPKGRIAQGLDADLIVLDETLKIHNVYLKGEPQC